MATKITQADLLKRLKALGDMTNEQRNSVVCSLIGHSRIQTVCFGYYNCGRCDDQVGDSLASIYPDAKNVVAIGHNCDTCRENFKALTWRDKLYAPDPFTEAK